MRSVLHDPGAHVVVGLLSFSTSFVGIGLAVRALDTKGTLTASSNGAFGVAAFLFVFGLIVAFLLWRNYSVTKGQVRQIGLFLRQGLKLRRKILEFKGIWKEEDAEPAEQWEKEIQQWLDDNLPDHAPDFDLETISGTVDAFYYGGLDRDASKVALHLESILGNLREILRDVGG